MLATWDDLLPKLFYNTQITIYMVTVTFILAGILGLAIGLTLNVTRAGGLLANRAIFAVLNIIVNTVRPIPFIILVALLGPITRSIIGTHIGNEAAIFVMVIGAAFSVGRIVEQNLVSVDSGVIEAVKAAGAKPFRIIFTVIIPEALGPLILGYTYVVIGIVDMSAMVGALGAEGLGNFALVNGFHVFRSDVTLVATLVIILMVQGVQSLGNWLAKRVLQRR